jgi:transcriptional regulator with XRE-family HTH domain
VAPVDLVEFARRLRTLMADRHVSRGKLAAAVSVDPATVSAWRKGSYMPTGDKRELLARALKTTVTELFDDRPARGSLIREAMLGDADGAERVRQERRFLAHFRADMVELYALDPEVAAAEALVQVPEALAFLQIHRPDATPLEAMRLMAGFVAAEVARRHNRPQEESDAVQKRLAALILTNAPDTEVAAALVDVPLGQFVNRTGAAGMPKKNVVRKRRRGRS